MPQSRSTKTAATQKRNVKRYKTFIFRVRRGSELESRLLNFAEKGNTSINFVITKALCKYFKCALPHYEYRTYKRTPLYKSKED